MEVHQSNTKIDDIFYTLYVYARWLTYIKWDVLTITCLQRRDTPLQTCILHWELLTTLVSSRHWEMCLQLEISHFKPMFFTLRASENFSIFSTWEMCLQLRDIPLQTYILHLSASKNFSVFSTLSISHCCFEGFHLTLRFKRKRSLHAQHPKHDNTRPTRKWLFKKLAIM